MQPENFQPSNQPIFNGQQTPESYNVDQGRKPVKKSPRFSNLKEHLSTVLILISAPLLAILLTVFVFRTYQVDGPSMETTLQNNDRLIINKIPRTISKITGNAYIPDRYEVVVFNQGGSTSFEGSNRQLIKRVIGLPGDRVVVKNGVVKVFNSKNPSGFEVDRQGPTSAIIGVTEGNVDETVDKDEVFIMGDNRANSLDSRAFGAIKVKDIVGKLTFRIYPLDKWESY